MDLDLILNSFPKLLSASIITLKLLSISLIIGMFIGLFFAILRIKNNIIFGKIAYVEVGAMMVGKIVQSFKNEYFNKGDEKGYFLFGGSTVIIFGEKGKWTPDGDILANTQNGMETYLQLGESCGGLL